MKFTKSADFALRTVIYLAQHPGPIPMPVVATELFIPYNNLIKIVQKLRRADIVSAKQGKSGGVYLKLNPSAISIRTIVDAIDGPTRLSECLTDDTYCKLRVSCLLQGVLGRLQANINGMLDDISIASILELTVKKENAYV
ncbi:MAG: Rrf2 family transcriptional regulator [bacterium]|nr:Rrf2 family transcriptional regulator [bacterium]